MLIHDDKPLMYWRLAVVENLIPGGDRLICTTNICTSTGKTNGPNTKLYPLEVNTNLDTTVPITVTDTKDSPAPSIKRHAADSSGLPDSCPQRVVARSGRIRISE